MAIVDFSTVRADADVRRFLGNASIGKTPPQFDGQQKITKPFELLPGGYIGYFDLNSASGWQQLAEVA